MNIDVIIVLAYFAIMVGCGIVGIRIAKNNDDYLVAGRRLPFWMYFPCLASVILGGGATFGSAKLSYLHGISGSWVVLMYGFGIMAMGVLLSSKLANLRVISLSEMLSVRYCAATRYVSAVIGCIYAAMIAVVQIIAIGTVLHAFLGWDLTTSMLVGGGISLAYTLLGGMWSVTITDCIQFVLMIFGIFGCLVPMGLSKVGGFATLKASVPADYFNPVAIGWDSLFAYFLLMFLGIMIGQDIWQRVFTARDTKVATTGTVVAGAFSVLWGVAMALIGMMAFILLPDLDQPQNALGQLVVTVIPTGLRGIVIAGLLSTLMSTVSGTILASSTLIMNDLVKPFLKLESKKELVLTRTITTIVGIFCLLLAVTIRDVMAALDIAYALLSGAIFVPVIAGFFWKRATWQGAVSSIIVSGIVTVIFLVLHGTTATTPIMYGMATSAAVLVGVSLLTAPDEKALEEWERKLATAEAD